MSNASVESVMASAEGTPAAAFEPVWETLGAAASPSGNRGSLWFIDGQQGRAPTRVDQPNAALLAQLTSLRREVEDLARQAQQMKTQRDEARGALDTLAMAVVIVGSDLRVSYANTGASEILSDPDAAIGLRQGRLFARQPADHRQIRRLVEAVLRGGDPAPEACPGGLILQGSDPAHALSTRVMPVASARSSASPPLKAMIALRPLCLTTDLVVGSRQLFNLTESEARFASALASGLSLTQAAQAQGVRISTARTHLARIFQKTETRQQSQLVSLLRGAVLPLRPCP